MQREEVQRHRSLEVHQTWVLSSCPGFFYGFFRPYTMILYYTPMYSRGFMKAAKWNVNMQFLSSHDPAFYGSDPCLIEARAEALDNMMKVGRVILFVACDFKTSIGHQAVAAVTCSWMLLAATCRCWIQRRRRIPRSSSSKRLSHWNQKCRRVGQDAGLPLRCRPWRPCATWRAWSFKVSLQKMMLTSWVSASRLNDCKL